MTFYSHSSTICVSDYEIVSGVVGGLGTVADMITTKVDRVLSPTSLIAFTANPYYWPGVSSVI
jgi:hypothetical protein